jgi:hypothetical protein
MTMKDNGFVSCVSRLRVSNAKVVLFPFVSMRLMRLFAKSYTEVVT